MCCRGREPVEIVQCPRMQARGGRRARRATRAACGRSRMTAGREYRAPRASPTSRADSVPTDADAPSFSRRQDIGNLALAHSPSSRSVQRSNNGGKHHDDSAPDHAGPDQLRDGRRRRHGAGGAAGQAADRARVGRAGGPARCRPRAGGARAQPPAAAAAGHAPAGRAARPVPRAGPGCRVPAGAGRRAGGRARRRRCRPPSARRGAPVTACWRRRCARARGRTRVVRASLTRSRRMPLPRASLQGCRGPGTARSTKARAYRASSATIGSASQRTAATFRMQSDACAGSGEICELAT